MKNTVKFLGIIAVAALIGLVSCDTGTGAGVGDGVVGGPYIGQELRLHGRVYQERWDSVSDRWITEPFSGNVPNLFGGFWSDGWVTLPGGSGAVTNGQLSFTMGVPSTPRSVGQLFGWLDYYFNNLAISNPNARMAAIEELRGPGGHEFWRSGGGTFIYVASNVTISGAGRTWTERWGCYCWNCTCSHPCDCAGSAQLTTNTFRLDLRQGWNAIHFVEQMTSANAYSLSVRAGLPPGPAVWYMWSPSVFSGAIESFEQSGTRGFRMRR